MDFMNLNQSAHGDREFAFMETRMGLVRKTVVGHWTRAARARADRRLGAGRRRLATRRTASRVARFGDNMREVAVTEGDKVEAQLRLGVTVSTATASASSSRRWTGLGRRGRRARRRVRGAYDVAPRASRGRRAARVAPRRGADRGGAARRSSTRLGSRAFTDTFEDLHGLKQLPGIAVQRLMADGYGFGAEGDWKTAALVRVRR